MILITEFEFLRPFLLLFLHRNFFKESISTLDLFRKYFDCLVLFLVSPLPWRGLIFWVTNYRYQSAWFFIIFSIKFSSDIRLFQGHKYNKGSGPLLIWGPTTKKKSHGFIAQNYRSKFWKPKIRKIDFEDIIKDSTFKKSSKISIL